MASGVGFVFPGQGSQSVGMGKALYDAYPETRKVYEQASAILGYDVAGLCFDGPAERLNLTEFTQPALLTASIAAWSLVPPAQGAPSAVAGHSLGEYAAAVAAGGVDFATAVGLVQKRGRYMAEAVPAGNGLVVAVLGLKDGIVQEACTEAAEHGIVSVANFNCPGQVVVAGEKAAVERVVELVKAKGCRKTVRLPVSVPVHTPLMRAAADRLADDIAAAAWSDLRVPLINNADAKPVRLAAELKTSLVRQLASSVRWEESIEVMHAMGVRTFVEIGPGTVLSGLIKRIVPDATTLHVQDPPSLERTVAALPGGGSSSSA